MSLDPHAILSGSDQSWKGRTLRLGLAAVEPAYRGMIAGRNRLFDAGWREVHRLARPTISVGNLTAGGTGKTPMVAMLCRHLQASGHQPAILTRGYATGDEPALLAAELGPSVPIGASPDRITAAGQVMAQRPDVDVFVLDDGFQRRQLHRDLDLVLIDATCPFGFDHVLPRGLLREPPGALRRADAVLVTRADQVTPAALAEIDAAITRHHGRPPVTHAAHRWNGWRSNGDGALSLDALAGQAIAAAVGIGNPTAFRRTLEQHVGSIAAFIVFPDHHDYTPAALRELAETAVQAGAQALVTTEKDHIKWAPLLKTCELGLPVVRPVLSLMLLDDSDDLSNRIASVFERSTPTG